MNKVFMMGRLTKDPEVRTTNGGTTVTTFSIAVDRRYTDQDGKKQTDFFNVTAWRKLGEICGNYLDKGRQVLVEGTLQNRSYDDKNGVKRYVTEIVAENVEFVGKRNESSSTHDNASASASAVYEEIDVDNLPF